MSNWYPTGLQFITQWAKTAMLRHYPEMRDPTPSEIKDAHSKCGTCRWRVADVRENEPTLWFCSCGESPYCYANDAQEYPIDLREDYCRHHEPDEEIK